MLVSLSGNSYRGSVFMSNRGGPQRAKGVFAFAASERMFNLLQFSALDNVYYMRFGRSHGGAG